MESGIFRFILRYSLREQIMVVLMSASALPFLYLTLELPKIIINKAIDGTDFPQRVLGVEFEQIPYLLLLCGFFLALVILSGAMKYFTSTFRYRVGDRLLRRLRYDLIERLLRFPPSEFRNMSSGQVVSMITAETSNLGLFIAEAFAVPAVALGTLSTILLFMFMQNWLMGAAAIALYPLQVYLLPKIQRRINALQRQEVLAMRDMSQRIGDVVTGVNEIHGHDTSQYELADFTKRLGTVYKVRVSISENRYIANILNQFFSQLTPFFFLSIGGYLVIRGQLSLGALVAVLAAYKDMYSPWKDLIDYYQKSEDARVRYDQLKEFFGRGSLLQKAMIEADPDDHFLPDLALEAADVVVEKEAGHRPVDGASIKLNLPMHAVVLGTGGSGREEFARLLARQVFPRSGSVRLGGSDLAGLPDSVTGRRIGYVSQQSFLSSGSIFDVLSYPLMRRPREHPDEHTRPTPELRREREEAARSGNSAHDALADWIDYEAAGCTDLLSLQQRMIEVLRLVDLDHEVYEIGLRRTISPDEHPGLVEGLIEARIMLRERLQSTGRTGLIEPFDQLQYNTHASVAENILFGTPVGPEFAIENLGQNDYLLGVIDKVGLTDDFLDMGYKLAAIKAEIFQGLSTNHTLFEQFSFINSADMPVFESILRFVEAFGMESLSLEKRHKLMSLPFKLVEPQHHVGLIDESMKARLLEARHAFARDLPDHMRNSVQFFQQDAYNADGSIFDNILFGKAATSKAGASVQIDQIVAEIVHELGLRDAITTAGLEYQIGVGGARLNTVQRQKLVLARCLLKRPDILILNDALTAFDHSTQQKILAGLKAEFDGRSLILFESSEIRRLEFEKVLRMEQGRFILDESGGDPAGDSTAGVQVPVDSGSHDADLNRVATMLMDIPLFGGIDRSKLKLLAFASEQSHYDAGQEVFRQGDPGDRAYVVIEGEADVVLESPTGSKTVATLGQNEIFGEMALLSKMPRTTTIRARTPLILLSVSQDIFLQLLEENSEIAIAMLRVLAQRLASTLHDYGVAMSERSTPDTLPAP